MAIPVCVTNISIKLLSWPGRSLGGVGSCVGTSLARNCAFTNCQIHWLLFDDGSASASGLRGDRGRTGLVVLSRLGWVVALLCVTGRGLGQFGFKALNVRLLVYIIAYFGQRAISTLIGPQFRREKCIWGVVVVAIVHCRQIWVVTIYWVWCTGLARWGKASPCIVGRVWIDVTEWVCCLVWVSIY